MSIKYNKQKLLRLSLCAYICILFFASCSTTKLVDKNAHQVKWVNWEVEFKKGVSDSDKSAALNALIKYATDSLYIKATGMLIRSIDVTVRGDLSDNRFQLGISLRIVTAGQNGVSSPIVPPIPPKHEGPFHVFRPIMNIKENIH